MRSWRSEQVDPAQPLHADLEEIRKAAERSADLTRQLLAFARKQTVTPRVLDLNETVAGMLKMLRRLIGEDIDLEWQPGADLWPVKMDPSQIDQILANLCVNARDAIAGVGTLTIETGNSTLDEDYCAASRGVRARRVRAAHRERQRLRHGQGDAVAPLRAVLHDQGGGQGHRPRAGHGLRHRQAERRLHQRRTASRARGRRSRSTCPGMRAQAAPRRSPRARQRRCRAATRRSCWWRTSRRS